jgi:acyl-CoA thioesterase FadM
MRRACAARFVLVAMDLDRQRAQAVPDDLRALMLAFREGGTRYQ